MSKQTKELTPLQQEVNEHHKTCKSLVVGSLEQMARAQAVLITINKTIKKVHEEFDDICAKAWAAHKAATGKRKSHLEPLEYAKKVVSGKIGKYQLKLEEEEQERQRQARLKAEEEERERERKLKEQEEEECLKRAEHAESMGNEDEINEILDAKPEIKPEPLILPEPVTLAPKLQGMSARDVWKWELEDISKLPSYLVKPDEPAIDAMVKAQKGNCRIPGIRVYKTKSITQRV